MSASAKGSADWAAAAECLADRSALAETLLGRHGAPQGFRRSRPDERFETLARVITFQQLSGKAASTIWARVAEVVGDTSDPSAFTAAGHDTLRSAGLSNAKARALADLGARVTDGRLDLRGITRMADDDVIGTLTDVRGIGPWSAQMFLISSLGRTDVWPTGDVGVRNGWAIATAAGVVPDREELEQAGEPHRPYRSVLAWWCWRETDTRLPT